MGWHWSPLHLRKRRTLEDGVIMPSAINKASIEINFEASKTRFLRHLGTSEIPDAAFLLTVGSFLLTVELFYSQFTILAFLLTIGAFLLTVLASLLTVGAFLLTVGKCV